MNEKMGIIYKITNKVNNFSYIGLTKQSIKARWRGHRKNKSGCLRISRAIKKYGEENFDIEVLGQYPLDKLSEMEIYFIQFYNTLSPNGYNLTKGGRYGGSPSQETRDKISKARMGKKLSEEVRKNISEGHKGEKNFWFGKYLSEETKAMLSVKATGRKHTEEVKRKMSENGSGEKHPNFGKHLSEETKKRISQAKKGKSVSKRSDKFKEEQSKRTFLYWQRKKAGLLSPPEGLIKVENQPTCQAQNE
jgi:group I intron endonuclease